MICQELELVEDFYDAGEGVRFLRHFLEKHQWPDNSYEYAGRRFVLPRLQTWHADAGIRYSYSNNLLLTRPWTESLSEIRRKVEAELDHEFNSVLVNYYRNGEDHVAWHADNEIELGRRPIIASVSFGARRFFAYRHKITGESGRMILPSGSLLIMPPDFQQYWLHSVPQDQALSQARINLTFRRVIEPV